MIVFLHTAPVHIATFDALRDRFAPDLAIRHVVREDLLENAVTQGGVTPEIEAAATAVLAGIMTGGVQAIVCTCSTLGAVAESFDAEAAIPVIRIDRPMADNAVMLGNHIAVCGAASTALASTMALLHSSAKDMDRANVTLIDHLFASAWKYFERGDMDAYHREVARGLRGAALTADLIILAQASMHGAIAHCPEITVPIWSSPETGFRAALALIDYEEKTT
ncbi:MAG TPA: aspartate/glutamate racemase family protein [Alphaproteobacteria bacterium]|nr:aspartate/glutamate racemase family protein [Alphaproteobacteria bacterium]